MNLILIKYFVSPVSTGTSVEETNLARTGVTAQVPLVDLKWQQR